MTDEKIYDLFQQREDRICERFESNLKTLTEFIAVENQGIKKSIDDLRLKVEQQNSSVKKLNEWKAEVTGRNEGIKEFKRERLTNWQLVGVIFAIIVGLFSILGFVKSMSNSKQVETIDNKLYWKADRMPDSTVRDGANLGFPPINKDTAFINDLERSYREIMNK